MYTIPSARTGSFCVAELECSPKIYSPPNPSEIADSNGSIGHVARGRSTNVGVSEEELLAGPNRGLLHPCESDGVGVPEGCVRRWGLGGLGSGEPVLPLSVLRLPVRLLLPRVLGAHLSAADVAIRGSIGPTEGVLRQRLLSPARRWRDRPLSVGLDAGHAGAAPASAEPVRHARHR